MDYLQSVQAGIDYIEANLDHDIALSAVAKSAGLSQWHFQRIFKALTTETLKTYIRSRRLANSLDKLLTTDQRIIDIAFAAGYESQESFTRAFKAAFRLTPNEYRKLGDRSLFLKKVEFNREYLQHINQKVTMIPQVFHQDVMRLVGLRTTYYGTDSDKNNMGDKLPGLWDAFVPRLDEIAHTVPGVCYGVIRQIRADSEQLEYYAAIEVSKVESVPDGMTVVDIEPAQYARFAHKGDVKQMDNTVNYIYSSWLLNANKRHTSGPDLEVYGAEYRPDSDESVTYYAIPVE